MSREFSEQEKLYNMKRKFINDSDLFPKFIYKYCKIDNHLKENLLKNQIWFSSAKKFNDPFDCKIPFKIYESYAEFQELVNKLRRWKAFNIDVEIEQVNPNDIKSAVMDSLQGIFESMGVACFSLYEDNIDEDNSLLLWSHYADSHKGVRLEFQLLDNVLYMFDLDKLANPILTLRKVEYVIDFPKLNYVKDQSKFQIELISTKSKHWKYENEVRILSKKTSPVQFQREALTEITFGCCVDETDRKDIIKLLISCKYPRIQFTQAVKCDNKFALEYKEISKEEVLEICKTNDIY